MLFFVVIHENWKQLSFFNSQQKQFVVLNWDTFNDKAYVVKTSTEIGFEQECTNTDAKHDQLKGYFQAQGNIWEQWEFKQIH